MSRVIKNKLQSTSTTTTNTNRLKRLGSLESLKNNDNSKKPNHKLILFNFRQYKNRKAFRTLLSVTCSLIVFWAPWIILWPVDAWCQCLPRYVYICIYIMEYLNSLINSIFIVAGNQHFRRKFLITLRRILVFSSFSINRQLISNNNHPIPQPPPPPPPPPRPVFFICWYDFKKNFSFCFKRGKFFNCTLG